MEKYIFTFLLCLISTATINIDKYRKDCLEKHNYYRSLHQVGKVKNDQILEKAAMEVSDLLAFKIKDLVWILVILLKLYGKVSKKLD